MKTNFNEEFCSECNGIGYFEKVVIKHITREMAIDADELQLEGQPYRFIEYIECGACGGSGIILTEEKETKDGQ